VTINCTGGEAYTGIDWEDAAYARQPIKHSAINDLNGFIVKPASEQVNLCKTSRQIN
jgi:hypothetical protein